MVTVAIWTTSRKGLGRSPRVLFRAPDSLLAARRLHGFWPRLNDSWGIESIRSPLAERVPQSFVLERGRGASGPGMCRRREETLVSPPNVAEVCLATDCLLPLERSTGAHWLQERDRMDVWCSRRKWLCLRVWSPAASC
ncbi:hypothetical protein SKAU_G00198790 [Synaphobranchus kaupii]|uniref:Uncharacterized protein n=1 Tax=Synaphobranchus kaupii TaxID=118154 RepID=A0A9Q1IY65_SYNKA|nr:hypothetical protein SKAU_G00198790 [Synaphobranchus kaupii]